jgi:hypothetical protein
VVDSYSNAQGEMRGRLAGRVTLFHATDPDTTRSAAGRAALESLAFAPATVLPELGVRWRAESDDRIVAEFDLPPEKPEVHAVIDGGGALRSVSALRWGNVGQKQFAYIPFGGETEGEVRFGELVLPRSLRAGWWFGTPRYEPFFEASILDARLGGPL